MERLCVLGLCWCALAACQGGSEQQVRTHPESAPPRADNVILITIDTLRADVLEIHGGPAKTPVLSALARHGWWFESCTSASMLTNPSHASIMTSLYPRDHGVYDNQSGVPNGVGTIASALRAKGFETGALIGFPHLNPNVSNLGQGFGRVVLAGREERRARDTSQRALGLLDELRADRPFFLWVHYTDPHAPYEPPDDCPPRPWSARPDRPIEDARRGAPGFQRKNEWFTQAFNRFGRTADLVARYVAEVEAADEGLGALVRGLQERGLARSTALVVTSDHGENLGDHDLYFHHGGLYPATTHVPLIIAVPGASPGRIGDPVATVDIAPTILSITHIPRWEPMRGQSLVPVALGQRAGRRHVFSEHMNAQLVAARSEDALLVIHRKTTKQFPSYPFESGYRELWLPPVKSADPMGGWRSVPARGDLAEDLERAVRSYLGAGLELTARTAISQDRDSLRALGYIE